MPRSSDDLLEQLVYNLMKKVDDLSQNINNKIDDKTEHLQNLVCEENRCLRKEVADRLHQMEAKLEGHEQRIHKVEHKWATLTFFISAGVAAGVALLDNISSFFGLK